MNEKKTWRYLRDLEPQDGGRRVVAAAVAGAEADGAAGGGADGRSRSVGGRFGGRFGGGGGAGAGRGRHWRTLAALLGDAAALPTKRTCSANNDDVSSAFLLPW